MISDLRTLPPSKKICLDMQRRLLNTQVLEYVVEGQTRYCISAQDLIEAGLPQCAKPGPDEGLTLHEQYITDPSAKVHTLERRPYIVDYEEAFPILLAAVQSLAKDMRDQVQQLRRACLPIKKIRVKDANGQFHWVKQLDEEFESGSFIF